MADPAGTWRAAGPSGEIALRWFSHPETSDGLAWFVFGPWGIDKADGWTVRDWPVISHTDALRRLADLAHTPVTAPPCPTCKNRRQE